MIFDFSACNSIARSFQLLKCRKPYSFLLKEKPLLCQTQARALEKCPSHNVKSQNVLYRQLSLMFFLTYFRCTDLVSPLSPLPHALSQSYLGWMWLVIPFYPSKPSDPSHIFPWLYPHHVSPASFCAFFFSLCRHILTNAFVILPSVYL